jgi:uncharacterized protein
MRLVHMAVPLLALIAGVILAVMLAGGVGAEPLEEGVAAPQRGDDRSAAKLTRSLAERGDANAQYSLGEMYSRGTGVPADTAEAAKWYRRCCETGTRRSSILSRHEL